MKILAFNINSTRNGNINNDQLKQIKLLNPDVLCLSECHVAYRLISVNISLIVIVCLY